MPKLMNIKVRRTWRGLYPMSPDGSPIVGESDEVEGYIHAVGMCGQGFMLGPGLATYLVKLCKKELGDEDRAIADKFSPYRDFAGTEKLK